METECGELRALPVLIVLNYLIFNYVIKEDELVNIRCENKNKIYSGVSTTIFLEIIKSKKISKCISYFSSVVYII